MLKFESKGPGTYSMVLVIVIALLSGVPWGGPGLNAQSGAELASVSLEVIQLTQSPMVPLFYRGVGGEYTALRVGNRTRGMINELASAPVMSLYREVKDPESDEQTMVPLFSLSRTETGSRSILFFADDADGKRIFRVFRDDGRTHGGQEVRLINLTAIDVAFLLDDSIHQVSPGSEAVVYLGGVGENRFRFTFGLRSPGGFEQYSPVKALRFRSDQDRLMAVATYQVRQVETDELTPQGDPVMQARWVPEAVRLYDQVPVADD